ncbi:MAG: hypothetical protein B6227_04295 [Fusobacteriia bacterium 4572_74]|nr:MAG: hypothetical protein B6227_04295 [Fusobacteriia bacterium 4572_74]
MKFENVEFKEQKCFGIEKHITITNKKEGLINSLWMTFVKSINYTTSEALYGVSRNFDMTTQEFDYSACAEINTPILKEFEKIEITIPEGINSFELYDNSYLGIDNPESVYYLLIPIK